ncbi:trypsin-like peptidase domain-containing protein [Micromonospora sp. NPDC048868]|uniref:trypsin-like peptidase domain-containing protein n=1 Tax=Micromonospora sp. NPDC048868 TaxID=3364258 RepID=UPI0037222982
MQPEGPYRFTHMLGGSPVGKAWAAIDGQGRLVTVAVLDAAVAAAPGWREAFAGIVNSLAQAQAPNALPYTYADFSAASPWVAYSSEVGPGAEKLFRALGVEYEPAPAAVPPVSAPPQQVSGIPQSVSGVPHPVSGMPHPVSGLPHVPWAMHTSPVSAQPASAAPYPVSAAPASPAASQGVPAPVAGETVQMPVVQPRPPAEPPPDDPFVAPARRIQSSTPPPRRTGRWVAVAALLLVAALGGGVGAWAVTTGGSGEPAAAPAPTSTAFPTATPVNPGLKPWAQAALYSPEERALATAAPSMVFVEVIFTGYVRNKQGDAPLREAPVTFSRRCSGFVVNHDGHVLTNGQCVQPTEDIVLAGALSALANVLVSEKKLDAKDVSAYTRARMRTTRFTGAEATTAPEVKLFGQLNAAKGDVTDSPAIPGTIVRALTLEEGNLALVKLAQQNLPAAELNPSAAVSPETPLLILGYGTTDASFRSATYTVLSKPVRVTGVDTQSTVGAYRISEDVGLYSRGGIAIDPQGRVVGLLDNDLLRPDKANRLVAPVSTMTGLLGAAGVQNSLGEPDKLYRSGLDAYFAGDEPVAISRFSGVLEQSPANLLAHAYRQAAVDSGGGEGGSSARPGWAVPLLVASGVVLLIGLVALTAMLFSRRGNRA